MGIHSWRHQARHLIKFFKAKNHSVDPFTLNSKYFIIYNFNLVYQENFVKEESELYKFAKVHYRKHHKTKSESV